jgi:predicted transport protein
MDQATQTMIDNLYKNTGKTLQQWIDLVKKENFSRHGEMMSFLKEKHSLTHGFANLIALKARAADAGSADNQDDLIIKQYQGKEQLKPIYDKLMDEIRKFGKDVEVAPKNAYVSLRRKKQFAILQPATKTRFEIGVNLKGQDAKGKLETINSANAMCSHKINITDIKNSAMMLKPATTPNSFRISLFVSANTANSIAAAILQNKVTIPILLIISTSALFFSSVSRYDV